MTRTWSPNNEYWHTSSYLSKISIEMASPCIHIVNYIFLFIFDRGQTPFKYETINNGCVSWIAYHRKAGNVFIHTHICTLFVDLVYCMSEEILYDIFNNIIYSTSFKTHWNILAMSLVSKNMITNVDTIVTWNSYGTFVRLHIRWFLKLIEFAANAVFK